MLGVQLVVSTCLGLQQNPRVAGKGIDLISRASETAVMLLLGQLLYVDKVNVLCLTVPYCACTYYLSNRRTNNALSLWRNMKPASSKRVESIITSSPGFFPLAW